LAVEKLGPAGKKRVFEGMSEKLSCVSAPIQSCVYRGRILHSQSESELEYWQDGGLVVNAQGVIEACDAWDRLETMGLLKELPIVELSADQYLVPGFVDMHVHLPQMEVAGCQAENLLSWLDQYIFSAEARFADPAHALAVSQWFFHELLKNGTTTAAVFLTSHDAATRIAFEVAESMGNRVIMGQNLMDCQAPDALLKPAPVLLKETEAHCQQWHGRDQGRLQYAWVPRFAITSTEELMAGLGQLRVQYPDVYLHTHLSEQIPEIEAVLRQFPWAKDYTGVYERFGLLKPKSILAHGIHLSDGELDLLQAQECALAHCPSSNFFLKSGRFRLMEMLRRAMRFGLGSDVGAGPELSLFKVMKDAQFMQPDILVPLPTLFYLATLGGARALMMHDRIGNFEAGKEADFLILDSRGKACMGLPGASARGQDVERVLSQWVYLGDDRLVTATYVRGRCVYRQA
jgi:guanine deaminase